MLGWFGMEPSANGMLAQLGKAVSAGLPGSGSSSKSAGSTAVACR